MRHLEILRFDNEWGRSIDIPIKYNRSVAKAIKRRLNKDNPGSQFVCTILKRSSITGRIIVRKHLGI